MDGGTPKLTPERRAAFVGALALVPGVQTLGRTTDPNGNDTIGFVRQAGGRSDEELAAPGAVPGAATRGVEEAESLPQAK
ncbi:MAG: hypothetical protein HYX29_03890 [Solirubrobacterales bacterium]|nr:hypothetical protein [Solirubrobacterales bacterium]